VSRLRFPTIVFRTALLDAEGGAGRLMLEVLAMLCRGLKHLAPLQSQHILGLLVKVLQENGAA
jgi:hypothetical protein